MEVFKFFVGVIMIGCFLAQMWELFEQFISELKTVAVSFKHEKTIEFPSFAFCDSKAFTEKIGFTPNVTLYNASTFNLEPEISLVHYANHSVESFPTNSNGYCTLYQIHGKYDISRILGTLAKLIA